MTLLLEVLLGLALFALAILFVFGLFPTADRSVAEADRAAQATQLARRLLEGQLALDYNAVTPPGYSGSQQVQHATRRGVNMLMTYNYQVDIQVINPPDPLKSIHVRVDWQVGTGVSAETHTVQMQTNKGAMW